MNFDEQKKIVLDKLYLPDRSKKGSVDSYLIPLIDEINKHENYYTTSSCSGRIMLFSDNDAIIKKDASWLFVSHNPVSFEELDSYLVDFPNAVTTFRMEGMILHVACRSLDDAKKFIIFCQNNGFKHTGLLSLSKRFIVQVMGVDRFDAPIAVENKLLVSKDYVKFLLDLANKKLEKIHEKIDSLFEAFKKEFN